jgi:hypothetical protein
MPPIVPLLSDQVAAACRLRAWLPHLVAAEQALTALERALPDVNPENVLLKVVALNGLQASGVHAVHAMAGHVLSVLQAGNPREAGPDIVDRLGWVPATNRHHTVFASKFAHFFIDAGRFAIFEGYALTMLRHHLARTTLVIDAHRPYWAFVENLATLRTVSGISAPPRDLDLYFWIASACLAWRRDRTSPVSPELRQLFHSAQPDVIRDLAIVGGAPDPAGSRSMGL